VGSRERIGPGGERQDVPDGLLQRYPAGPRGPEPGDIREVDGIPDARFEIDILGRHLAAADPAEQCGDTLVRDPGRDDIIAAAAAAGRGLDDQVHGLFDGDEIGKMARVDADGLPLDYAGRELADELRRVPAGGHHRTQAEVKDRRAGPLEYGLQILFGGQLGDPIGRRGAGFGLRRDRVGVAVAVDLDGRDVGQGAGPRPGQPIPEAFQAPDVAVDFEGQLPGP